MFFQVPERVYKHNPQMKILLVVRDPVTRVVSNFMHDKRKSRAIRSPGIIKGRSLESIVTTSTGDLLVTHEYIRISSYYEHLKVSHARSHSLQIVLTKYSFLLISIYISKTTTSRTVFIISQNLGGGGAICLTDTT